MKWGDEIRIRRKELGMTQKQLAERLECHPLTVSYWERGIQIPSRIIKKAVEIILG